MHTLNLLMLFGATLFSMAPGVFWAYFAAFAISVVALFSMRKQVSVASGLEKVVAFGPLLFSAPLVVFASEHFTATSAIAQLVPTWIPAHVFWVYFVGSCLIAAALSITVEKHTQLAATLLALMLFLFVLLIHIPSVIATQHDRTRWTVVLRDLSFSSGALALAGKQAEAARARYGTIFVGVSRLVIAIAAIFFGVEQFLHPELLPGIPLIRTTPTWIPLHRLWSYLAGVVLIATGTALLPPQLRPGLAASPLLARINRRLAATWLGTMILSLVLIVYLPLVVSNPSDVGTGLNYFFDTLMFAGAALLLADALPAQSPASEPQRGSLELRPQAIGEERR